MLKSTAAAQRYSCCPPIYVMSKSFAEKIQIEPTFTAIGQQLHEVATRINDKDNVLIVGECVFFKYLH
jgi:hypothetical protein